jgi:tRNA A-37 threonylcarbamoyl transferase component Bud32
MHGLIFLQLQKFAQRQAGVQGWETLLREAGLPLKSYSAVQVYPDEEALALVAAADRVLNRPAAAVWEAFGEFVAPELLRLYGRLIPPAWKTLDLIENTERLIHAAVRVGNPDARPPVLECLRTAPDEVQIMYSSERQLCGLARGIVRGLARHYGEPITVSDGACMLRGDPFCVLQVRRVTATATPVPLLLATDCYSEDTPFSGTGQPPFPHGEPLTFLQPALQGDELGRLGDFRILQVLGQGGMGIVLRADDTRLARPVALKVMRPILAADRTMRQRFVREARAMAAVKSDHVVTVYEVGAVNDLPFLAMELLDGADLDTYHRNAGRLPPAQAARIGREAALGLAAAHARGLVHRDVKPANLWLEAPPGKPGLRPVPGGSPGGALVSRVKILDFGLARADSDTTRLSQVGVVLGTLPFMAPEQARGDAVDHRADLFSLGCVLYWLCTNELPFRGSDVLSTLTALATQDPPPPRTVSADVPAALSDLVMQLLQKDPRRRPASGEAVADALAVVAARHAPGSPAPLPLLDNRDAGELASGNR